MPSDGGAFRRLCAKMATGSGKTVVVAMVLAWHILNKVTSPQDPRFARHVLVVAPGLTVRNRLAVLEPSHPENYYDVFRIVPSALLDKLRQGKVVIRNWHVLNWEGEDKIAGKRGAKSDEAYVRDVLGDMARARGILTCYDFSATPFAPSGQRSSEEALFGWIVSDFGLNDAIESGLVKTPRVVIRDDARPDAKTYRSRLYHIYNDAEVKDDLSRPAKPEEPLPDLVLNGYYLLGYDWRETVKDWNEKGFRTSPVMITVANRTETAARIKHAFDRKQVHIDELCNPERTLHIDSKVLEAAEAAAAEPMPGIDAANDSGHSAKLTQKQRAELLRRQVDSVGRPGKEGERIQNVISVGMLPEGWDAKTVTHIMGLRAFTSQLLCEQVVGRGLRRTSYDVDPISGLFKPEYVNIFGVPFTFLPHEGGMDGPPPPPEPKTAIEPGADKANFQISWPSVVRIDHALRSRLSVDWQAVHPLNWMPARRLKWRFLDEWVCAVNEYGGFGRWSWEVSKNPGDVGDILARHTRTSGKVVARETPEAGATGRTGFLIGEISVPKDFDRLASKEIQTMFKTDE